MQFTAFSSWVVTLHGAWGKALPKQRRFSAGSSAALFAAWGHGWFLVPIHHYTFTCWGQFYIACCYLKCLRGFFWLKPLGEMETQGYYNLNFMQVLYTGSTKGSNTKPEQEKYCECKYKKYYLFLYGRNLPVFGKEIRKLKSNWKSTCYHPGCQKQWLGMSIYHITFP